MRTCILAVAATTVAAAGGPLSVAPGPVGPGLAVEGTAVVEHGGARPFLARLHGEVLAPLTGSLTPVAVPERGNRGVVYASWAQAPGVRPGPLPPGQTLGVPSVRRIELESSHDTLLAAGAITPAVATDGRIAWVQGTTRRMRASEPYRGRVVVDGKVWTPGAATYRLYAWSRTTLLAYRDGDLVALDGPSHERLLARGAQVVAIAPDGKRVAVVTDTRRVEIVRVAGARLERSRPLGLHELLQYAGGWRGSRIVASTGNGIVLLDARTLRVVATYRDPPSLRHGIYEPMLVSPTAVAGWAVLRNGRNALVRCDLRARKCTTAAPQPARRWTRWLANPSR